MASVSEYWWLHPQESGSHCHYPQSMVAKDLNFCFKKGWSLAINTFQRMAVIMATVFPLLQLRLCQHLNYKLLFSGVYILAINICQEMKIGIHCPKDFFFFFNNNKALRKLDWGFFYTARGKRIGGLLWVLRCISVYIHVCIHRDGGQVYS